MKCLTAHLVFRTNVSTTPLRFQCLCETTRLFFDRKPAFSAWLRSCRGCSAAKQKMLACDKKKPRSLAQALKPQRGCGYVCPEYHLAVRHFKKGHPPIHLSLPATTATFLETRERVKMAHPFRRRSSKSNRLQSSYFLVLIINI